MTTGFFAMLNNLVLHVGALFIKKSVYSSIKLDYRLSCLRSLICVCGSVA